MIFSYSGILLTKEQTTDIHTSVDESIKHRVMGKKPDAKGYMTFDSYMKSKNRQHCSVVTEVRKHCSVGNRVTGKG